MLAEKTAAFGTGKIASLKWVGDAERSSEFDIAIGKIILEAGKGQGRQPRRSEASVLGSRQLPVVAVPSPLPAPPARARFRDQDLRGYHPFGSLQQGSRDGRAGNWEATSTF